MSWTKGIAARWGVRNRALWCVAQGLEKKELVLIKLLCFGQQYYPLPRDILIYSKAYVFLCVLQDEEEARGGWMLSESIGDVWNAMENRSEHDFHLY